MFGATGADPEMNKDEWKVLVGILLFVLPILILAEIAHIIIYHSF